MNPPAGRFSWKVFLAVAVTAAAGCQRGGPKEPLVLRATPGFQPEVTIGFESSESELNVPKKKIGTAPIDSLVCTTCHTAFESFPTVHGAVHEKAGCLGCHRALADEHPVRGELEFGLVASGVGLCISCHRELAQAEGRHKAIDEQGCLHCHRPHVSKQAKLLKGETLRVICFECHAPDPPAFPHTPVAEGKCTGCHDPHRSDYSSLLLADGRIDLCLRCHEDKREPASLADVHTPLREEGCTTCHGAHGGAYDKLLPSPVLDLCGECHGEVRAKTESEVKHPPLETCTECHDPHGPESSSLLKTPGEALCVRCHEERAEGYESGQVRHAALLEGGCVTCHDPHGGDQAALQKAGPRDLCGQCHEEHLARIESHAFIHAPAKEGACTECHDPHSSAENYLLKRAFPALIKKQEYVREDVALCFACHENSLIEERKTDRATRFRDGGRNLHSVHVIEEKRTCRSCHEAHAGDQEHLIRSSLAYGSSGYEMKIEYRATEDGGTCLKGCHKERSYQR